MSLSESMEKLLEQVTELKCKAVELEEQEEELQELRDEVDGLRQTVEELENELAKKSEVAEDIVKLLVEELKDKAQFTPYELKVLKNKIEAIIDDD